jgi:hypothetical protein
VLRDEVAGSENLQTIPTQRDIAPKNTEFKICSSKLRLKYLYTKYGNKNKKKTKNNQSLNLTLCVRINLI